MDVIPGFADLASFALRFFTATDFFAVFPDFAAFFIVLAMCSPDADASAAGPRPETTMRLFIMRRVAAALRVGFAPFAFAAVFARLGALATAVPFFLVASAILAQRIGPQCRSVSHPRDERVP
jgi:hypothetical protein